MKTKEISSYEADDILTDLQIDALREVGNIGAAHAATALSQMLDEMIMIDVTRSHIIGLEDMQKNLFGEPTDKVAGVYMQVSGSGTHNLLMLFPYETSLQLVDMFFKRNAGHTHTLSIKDESALCEIGNVCACAYLNAIADLLDITLFPTIPALAIDMLGAVLQFPVLEIGMRADYIVIIQTEFIRNSDKFKGYFLFLPDEGVKHEVMKKFKAE